jgi:uncharacterized protein YgiM (DUF1202 family)
MSKLMTFVGYTLALASFQGNLQAEQVPGKESTQQTRFQAFTGKITKNKVRLRINATLDAPIAKELNKGDLLLIEGENEEFYAVAVPEEIKGYVFRTFVLDNKIEGHRVNVRLSPTTDAPVIAQLNTGDTVNGVTSPLNSKWLETSLPPTTRFYVSKDYVEKVGDAKYLSTMAKRRDEVNQLLATAFMTSQQEMQKTFPEINLAKIEESYKSIAHNYPDFPDQASRANELLGEIEENYLQKKIAYLEYKLENPSPIKQVATVESFGFPAVVVPADTEEARQSSWVPVEKELYEAWRKNHEGSQDDYYVNQKPNAHEIKGIVQPYFRPVKNRPGDYVLINEKTKQPFAYLYSTKVSLNDKVGQEVSLKVAERPNSHFAYPAYFVLEILP